MISLGKVPKQDVTNVHIQRNVLEFINITFTLRSIKAWVLNFSLISLYQLITANYMIVNIINT